MVVRGAPAIGVAAAFGAAFGAREIDADSFDAFCPQFEEVCALLAATRPTAVNLFWALERMKELRPRATRSCPSPSSRSGCWPRRWRSPRRTSASTGPWADTASR